MKSFFLGKLCKLCDFAIKCDILVNMTVSHLHFSYIQTVQNLEATMLPVFSVSGYLLMLCFSLKAF